ncbi:MAG: PAS domain S-box protein, partial [Desulfobacterales bacterium]|nr:PAS domain S-box protein [Desulfobacterales bacterium]
MSEKPTRDELVQNTEMLKKRIAELEKTVRSLGKNEKPRTRDDPGRQLPGPDDFFFTAFQISVVPMAISFAKDGRFIEVNEAFSQLTGYGREEVLGRTAMELNLWASPDDRDRLHNVLIDKGAFKNELVSLRTTTGRIRDCLFSSRLLKRDKERFLVSIALDVTENRMAEEARRESEEKHRLFFENAPIGIIHYNNAGMITDVNEAMIATFGSSRKKLVGLTIDQIPDRKFAREVHRSLEGERGYYEGEYQSYTGGKSSFLRANWFPIFRAGKVMGGVGMVEDVTERKKAAENLRLSRRERALILGSIDELVIFHNLEHRIVWANKVAADSLNMNQEDLIGGVCWELWHGRDKPCEGCPVQFAMKKKMSGKMEVSTPEGRHWVIRGYPALDEEGEIIGAVEVTSNVTEQKEAEKALRITEEKLSRAKKMEAMGLLAGGVAHDLNNILSGIVSYPELILLDLPEESPLKAPLETMLKSGVQASAIVEDLLTVARGIASPREVVNLNDIVRHYMESPEYYNLRQSRGHVAVNAHLDAHLLNISGSKVHIRKALMNLAANAVEAAGVGNGGRVSISTENTYLDHPLKGYDEILKGEYAVLTVSDNGGGISEVDRQRIFEPFYSKKVMGRSGSGLGLAVVWNTVQDHDGYINVANKGEGAVFDLYFPITRDEAPGKHLKTPLEDLKGNGENILLIDDEETQREIARGILQALNYETETIASGEEAVAHLRERPADLVILDMIMDPGIDGLETYKRIVESYPGQKAIIASGFAETDRVKEAKRLG